MASKKGGARRWAGCAGLNDAPLLPPLFTDVEDTYTITLLLQVYLRLCLRAGIRPLAIHVDDLAANFQLIVATIESRLPNVQRSRVRADGPDRDQRAFLADGGIIIDDQRFCVHGLLLGQDPLHVYFHLTEHLNAESSGVCFRIPLSSEAPQGVERVELAGANP